MNQKNILASSKTKPIIVIIKTIIINWRSDFQIFTHTFMSRAVRYKEVDSTV